MSMKRRLERLESRSKKFTERPDSSLAHYTDEELDHIIILYWRRGWIKDEEMPQYGFNSLEGLKEMELLFN